MAIRAASAQRMMVKVMSMWVPGSEMCLWGVSWVSWGRQGTPVRVRLLRDCVVRSWVQFHLFAKRSATKRK